jgi:hypothetical protein
MTAGEVAGLLPILSALDAVTVQVVTALAANIFPVIAQFAPVTEKVTAPLPTPPEVVSVTELLTMNLRFVLEIENGI